MHKVLVTGASAGIGRAVAMALARDGALVTAVGRHNASLETVVRDLPGAGHRALAADLATPDGLARVVGDVETAGYGVLVNNAGVGAYGVFQDQPLATLQGLLRLNLDAVVALSHAYLRHARKGDALINVASTLAFLPMADHAVYGASKAFVASLSEALWAQNRSRGVYVAALCPGVTATGFSRAAGAVDGQQAPAAITQQPDEVAAVLMAGLRARSGPTLVCGVLNKAMVLGSRGMSRKALASVLGTQRRGAREGGG